MSLSRTNSQKSLVSCKSSQNVWEKPSWSTPQAPSTQTEPPTDICIHRLFEQQVHRTPQAIAVSTKNTQTTYQQLNRQANRLAYQLSALEIGPGQLVGLCVEHSLDMVVGILGILKAGGAYVPIEPHTPAKHVDHILRDSSINILLTQTHLEQSLAVCQHRKNITLLCLDRDQWTKMQSCPDLGTPTTTDNLIYVLYPIESNTPPKSVAIDHSSIRHQLHWKQATCPLNNQDRVLQTLSFSSVASAWQIFWPLLAGSQLVFPPISHHLTPSRC